jgi:hypothetical protein
MSKIQIVSLADCAPKRTPSTPSQAAQILPNVAHATGPT